MKRRLQDILEPIESARCALCEMVSVNEDSQVSCKIRRRSIRKHIAQALSSLQRAIHNVEQAERS
jgi:hypothetical protein